MDTFITFICTPTADTQGTTLVLQTPKKHYFFGNESEGTQRALTEMGQRITKAQDFFVTGKTEWSNIGGLIGMALTLADASATSYESQMEVYRAKKGKKLPEPPRPKLNLYGPPNLKHMLASCRRFIFRKGLPIIATEFKASEPAKADDGTILPTWKDENIQVWALSVAPSEDSIDSEAEAVLASRRNFFDTELNNFNDCRAPQSETADDREKRYDRIRTSVLNHMFDSNWSFDTLVERHISEVEMPTVMYVRNPDTKQLDLYKGPMPGGSEPLPDITVLTRTPWPGALVANLPPTKPASESVSYIVRTYPARGKFDVQKAIELGVPKGPAFAQLTNGKTVTIESGKTITPDMVLGPDRQGQGIAILDVPSARHLEALVQREELRSSSVMEGIQACIWLLGPGLSGHPTLHKFIQQLDKVQHVMSSTDNCPNRLALDSVAAQTIRLGQIDGDRYHVPFHDNATVPQNNLRGRLSHEAHDVPNAITADRGLKFRLMPQFEIHKETISSLLDIPSIEKKTSPEIIELAKAAHKSIDQDSNALQAWRQLLDRPDSEVVTLGTGSALPSKYRNVSSTLVRVPGVGNYLFDCGENTLGQLQRVFEPDEFIEVIRNLRMIWISHLHADHHLGTASVIKAWYSIVHASVPLEESPSMPSISANASKYGLTVISHDGMLNWLNEYSSVEDFGYSRIVPLQITPSPLDSGSGSKLYIWPSPSPETYEGEHTLRREDYETILGLADIQAVRVSHCYGAMAVSITFPESSLVVQSETKPKPLKISYSGDCRPSANFAIIGRDTTVLIHEATFDDELQGDAIAKKHSTTSEALGVGARMNAKAVVLTHFSQRYQKIPILETINDGEEEDNLLSPEAVEDVDNEDGDGDEDMGNMDMTTTNAGSSALPTDKALTKEKSNEKVIKVRSKDMKVAIAFDYMRTRVGDIAKLEKFNAALNKLLVDEVEEEQGEDGEINKNGKKGSPSGGGGKQKKAKRNN